MHAGFAALPTHMPINIRTSKPRRGRTQVGRNGHPPHRRIVERLAAPASAKAARSCSAGSATPMRCTRRWSPASVPTAWTRTAPPRAYTDAILALRRCRSGSRRGRPNPGRWPGTMWLRPMDGRCPRYHWLLHLADLDCCPRHASIASVARRQFSAMSCAQCGWSFNPHGILVRAFGAFEIAWPV
jgi:hypothetical protein